MIVLKLATDCIDSSVRHELDGDWQFTEVPSKGPVCIDVPRVDLVICLAAKIVVLGEEHVAALLLCCRTAIDEEHVLYISIMTNKSRT